MVSRRHVVPAVAAAALAVPVGLSAAHAAPAIEEFMGLDVITAAEDVFTTSGQEPALGAAAASEEEPAPEAPATFDEELALEMVEDVNEFRAENGLPALDVNDGLTDGANLQTGKMVEQGSLFHASSDELWASADAGGCGMIVAENVGYNWIGDVDPGSADAAEIDALAAEHTQQFIDSPGHRDNLLSDEVTHIGVGYETTEDGQIYFTQQFSANCESASAQV